MNVIEIPAKPKEEKTIRVAAYARVSADKDAAFHSLEAQTEYYEEYVKNHAGWELVGLYSDNAISGTTINRPEFQRMLKDCRDGKIDLVVTKSITRFARNTVILLQTTRELKELGIDCYFEKENMHSISPDGEFFLTLLAMYAEEEARSTSENQKWRIKRKFEAGEPWVGNMLGYRLIDGQMIIVPEEAEIVRQIYSDYLSGMGKITIGNKLARSGVTAKYTKKWTYCTIGKILTNEKYSGNMLLQKKYTEDFRTKKTKVNHGELRQYYVECSHEPIIDRQTFEAVQEEIRRRQDIYCIPKRSTDNTCNLFVGIVFCGICGSRFVRKHHRYQNHSSIEWLCYKYKQRGKEFCPSHKIPEEILIQKTKEVLDVGTLSRDLIEEKITRIIVPRRNHLIYVLKNGESVDMLWEHKSRRESWTPEMRQQAREKALAQNRKEVEDER